MAEQADVWALALDHVLNRMRLTAREGTRGHLLEHVKESVYLQRAARGLVAYLDILDHENQRNYFQFVSGTWRDGVEDFAVLHG